MIQNELTYFVDGLKLINSYEDNFNSVPVVIITEGRINFNKNPQNQTTNNIWNFNFEYVNKDDYVIDIRNYTDNEPLICSIYCYPNKNKKISQFEYELLFKVVVSESQNDPEIPINDELIFLGIIYIPSRFPQDNKFIYFKSISEFKTSYSVGKQVEEWKNEIIRKLNNWEIKNIYIKKQIVRYQDSLYLANITHASSLDFVSDFNEGLWTRLTSVGSTGGGGEITDLYVDRLLENNYGNLYVGTFQRISTDNVNYYERLVMTKAYTGQMLPYPIDYEKIN